mgnify:CR=1 FL=1
MQQSRVIPSPRSFACDLATLCAPTLAGLKPAVPLPARARAGCRRHGRRLARRAVSPRGYGAGA